MHLPLENNGTSKGPKKVSLNTFVFLFFHLYVLVRSSAHSNRGLCVQDICDYQYVAQNCAKKINKLKPFIREENTQIQSKVTHVTRERI